MASASAGETSRSSAFSASSSSRPRGEPVFALAPVRRVLDDDEQQQKLQVRRRPLQPLDRVVQVDDRAVVDRLAPVGRAERPTLDRVAHEDDPAAGSGLLGGYRPERPRERPQPADG